MLSSLPALIDEFLPSNAGCAVAKVAVDRAIRIRLLPLGPVRDGRIVAVRAVGGWEQGPPLSSPSIKGQGEWIPLCLHPSNIPPSSVVVASPPQTGIQLIKICRSNQSLGGWCASLVTIVWMPCQGGLIGGKVLPPSST